MKITEIEYSVEVTINTGNFENVRPGYRLVATVEEGESVKAAVDDLTAKVNSLLEAQINEIQTDLAAAEK